jgi:hypothetical protein
LTSRPRPAIDGRHLQPLALGIERGRFGAQRRQRRLQLPRRLARLLTERADVLLPQQIGQQGLDLAVAVGAELPLPLCREDRGEEGVRRPADGLDASRIGLDLAIGDGAIGQRGGRPRAGVIQRQQIGLGPAAAPVRPFIRMTTCER